MYPRPPDHLSSTTRRWWTEVLSEFALTPNDLRLFQAACEAWDRMQRAQSAIQKYGRTIRDAAQRARVNPAVEVERECRTLFQEAVAQLHIPVDPSMIRSPALKRR